MEWDIGIHTVVMLCGPSQSGKSTWANVFKEKVSTVDARLRTTIIASDELRRELLGHDYHRYDPKMNEASEAAFELLFAQLKASIRFPVNTEFVVVDTTGLDDNFRSQVAEMAKANGYRTAMVVFDYPTNQYFSGLDSQGKTIVGRQAENLKKNVLPRLKRKNFDYWCSVKEKSAKYFDDMNVNIVDYALWDRCILDESKIDTSKPVVFVGDTHEHVDALKEIIPKLPDNSQLIFLGDYLDKGNNTVAMIAFMEQMVKFGAKIVKANHENFVARRLRGEVEALSNEKELFSSLEVLQNDSKMAARFLALFDVSLPFAKVVTHGKTIYATHAPCRNKSLGKLDEANQKHQRNFYFTKRDMETMNDNLKFVDEEASFSHPMHIFGHVAHSMTRIDNKNKVWLDTGAVYGNKLSALAVFPGGATKNISVSTAPLAQTKLYHVARKSEKVEVVEPEQSVEGDGIAQLVKKYALTPEDKYWLYSFKEGGAKFISGTMSPSKSSKTQLEPVHTAIEYFTSKGAKQVILQPKYMGSRLQVYLHRDRSLDFATTRSGMRAGNAQMMQQVYDILHEKFDAQEFWKESIIFDGELLPWSAIGKELIAKEFAQYGASVKTEVNMLACDNVFANFNVGFNAAEHAKAIKVFEDQLSLYGTEKPVEYKPFSIIAVDSISWMDKNQAELFSMLQPGETHLVLDLDENAIEKAQQFFDTLTNSQLAHEGMVVKPLVALPDAVPYMKVRNEKYLHLIYGYDYQFDYEKMVENKRTGKKMAISMEEFEIGKAMLGASSTYELLELACKMKFKMATEKELDPRL